MGKQSILHEVEIYLYENYLTAITTDYMGRVEMERTLGLKEVCDSAVLRGGANISSDAIRNGSEIMLKEMAYLLCDGFAINFGYFSISLKVLGVFDSPKDTFDPARHTLQFQITPGILMRSELQYIRVKTMGVKKNAIDIALVTDTLTGFTDGTVTPGEDIMIQGTRIRVAPDDGSDPDAGVFFIAENGTVTPVTRRLTQNDPSKVIARVPALPPGSYTLRIVTKNTSKGLLKNAISAEYDRPLIVV